MADPDKARQAREQWEFQMEEPLPWDARRQPGTADLSADRDSFFALDNLQE
jgi:hypothetical protein